METIELNDLNTAFRLHGSETRRSVTLLAVRILSENTPELQLRVLDEKDITMHTQSLPATPQGGEIVLNRKFVFYDHLTVQVQNQGSAGPFEIGVQIE